jgi:transposase
LETNATRMCALLVGLPDVTVVGVDDRPDRSLRVHVETTAEMDGCTGCGTRAWVKDRPTVALVDLPAFGRPAVLVWRKRRWRCPEPDCEMSTWTETDPRIAPSRAAMTDRAGRWVTVQVGREGRTVAEVARELGCDWHTVMDAVAAYGTPLIEDPDRIGPVTALGLDETLFARTGRWRTQLWCTSIVDVGRPAQLLDVVPGRTAAGPSAWLEAQPQAWRDGIAWGVLDLSGPYRKTFTDTLPHAPQVADPFHLVKHANAKLDECRRRVQNETLGHRGRRDDPLYKSRRLLTKGHERLDDRGETKLVGLLAAGDPKGEVRLAWHAKETIRGIYAIDDPAVAEEFVTELTDDLLDIDHPPEVRSLGRTLRRWHDQILAWHRSRVSNGPTEATNNLIKRIKRVGFGFRRFAHYRLRVLLYAGRPNWNLIDTIDPAQIR